MSPCQQVPSEHFSEDILFAVPFCTTRPDIPHGTVTGSLQPGSTDLTLTCDSGYTVQGAPDGDHCNGIGTDTCTINQCAYPNGRILRTQLTCGKDTQLLLRFSFFYALKYTQIIPMLISFVERECGTPSDVTNGTVMADCTYEGCSGNYTCDPGYILSTDSNTRVCASNGEWTGADPECSEYIMYV